MRGVVRDRLAGLHASAEIARLTAGARRRVPGAANIAKLWAGAIARRGAEVAAPRRGGGMLHDYDDGDDRDAP